MWVLAADTSSNVGSAALLGDGVLMAEVTFRAPSRQAELLLPQLEHLLSSCDKDVEDIELLAVGVGPGSFTGLRVGLATMKGLAVATGKPLVGVETGRVIAAQAAIVGTVAVLIDAFRGEVFLSFFVADGVDIHEVESPRCMTPEQAVLRVHQEAERGPLCVTGPALERYRDRFAKTPHREVRLQPDLLSVPRSGWVAVLGEKKFETEGVDEVRSLLPRYVRGADVTV